MPFSNAQAFAFTRVFTMPVEELNQHLSQEKFKPLEEKEISNCGWVNPYVNSDAEIYAVSADGFIMLKLHSEKKEIKASTIKKRVALKEKKIKEEYGRSLTKRERLQFEDEIVSELLPYAQTKDSSTMGCIIPAENLLIVSATSTGEAEDFCGKLRQTIGGLPITRMQTGLMAGTYAPPERLFKYWVKNDEEIPAVFEIGQSLTVYSTEPGSKGKVSFRNEELRTVEVAQILDSEKEVLDIQLHYRSENLIEVALGGMEFDTSDIALRQTLINQHSHEIDLLKCNVVTDNLILKSIKYDYCNIHEQEDDAIDSRSTTYYHMKTLVEFIKSLYLIFKSSPEVHLEDPNALLTIGKVEENFDQLLIEISDNEEKAKEEDEDPLLKEATQFCLEIGRASPSSLQRKFRIGYNRAARLAEIIKPQLEI